MTQPSPTPHKALSDRITAAKALFFEKNGSKPVSDEALCKFLGRKKGLSASTLYSVQQGNYPIASLAKIGLAFDQAVASARTRYGIASAIWVPGTTYDFPEWKKLQQALLIALSNAETGENQRLIWCPWRPGGGKSVSTGRLQAESGAVVIESQESWRKSYFATLRGIARAVGVDGNPRGEDDAEEKIISALASAPRIIAFDEVEFCGIRFVNFLRKLLSKTKAVIVIFCLPRFFEDFGRLGGIHTAQLMQRNVAVISGGKVSTEAAAAILAGRLGDLEELDFLAAELAAFANGSGCSDPVNQGASYRLAARVANLLAAQGDKITDWPAALESCVSEVRKNQGFALPKNEA